MPKVLDPTLLFFAFGMFAGLVRSNLEIPAQASKMLAQLLLIALGLKGGFALAHSGFGPEVLAGLGCALFLATAIPVLGYLSLRRLLPRFEAIALAASFGSVSAVAFIAATQRLEDAGLNFGGYMSAAMAIMESPAIVLAVVAAGFARHAAGGPHASVRPGRILHESLTDGTQMLLLGSMLIGYVSGDPGKAILQPVFLDLFRCILALFLLDMGLLVARNLGKLSLDQKPALVYALVAPFVHAALAQLGEETFAEIAGADAGRVEAQQQGVRGHDGLVGLAGTQRERRKVLLEEAALVQRVDQEPEGLLHAGVVRCRARLLGQVFGQRGFAGGGLHQVPTPFLILLRVALGADLLVVALVPVLLHPLEGVEIVVAQGELPRPFLLGVVAGGGRIQALGGGRLDFLEQGVRGHLLADLPQQFRGRHLQDAQGLAELGREHEALHLLLGLVDALVGHGRGTDVAKDGEFGKGYPHPNGLA